MVLRMRKPYRGSWYVCFSAMNFEPAVYMTPSCTNPALSDALLHLRSTKLLTEVNPFATLLIKIVTLTQIHQRSRGQGGNSLRASSPGGSGVGAGKGRKFATTSLEFDFHLQFPCGFPSTELSDDFRQSVQSGNESKCEQILKNRCQG